MVHSDAPLAGGTVFAVIEDAVVKAPLNIFDHFRHGHVLAVIQPLLNGSEVNRVLHDLKVVRNAQAVRVDRVVEDLGRATPPETGKQTFGRLVPVVIDRSVLILQVRVLHLVDQGGIGEQLCDYGAIEFKLFELLLGDLLVLAVPKDGKGVRSLDFVVLLHFLDVFLLGAGESVVDGALHPESFALQHLQADGLVAFFLLLLFLLV